MSADRLESRWRLTVLPIVCIRPRDGSPFWALTSVLLIACGFPPDSWPMMMNTLAIMCGVCGWASHARMHTITGCQRLTLSPDPGVLLQLADPDAAVFDAQTAAPSS